MKTLALATAAIIALGLSTTSSARIIRSNATGNWNNSSTWTPVSTPTAGDTVVINTGHTVTLPGSTITISGASVKILVDGVLRVSNNTVLNLPAGSGIYVDNGTIQRSIFQLHNIRVNGTSILSVTNSIPFLSVGGWSLLSTVINGPVAIPSSFVFGGLNPTPLPVELLAFDVKKSGKNIIIEWATAQELNNSYFAVERSQNGVDFEEIGRVEGNGTTFATSLYEFFDNSPAIGVVYYRLVQVDFDGTETVLETKSLVNSILTMEFWPNPVIDRANISFETTANDNIYIVITDNTGKERMKFTESSSDGVNQFSFDLTELSNGIYFIHVTDSFGSVLATKTFVK